MQVTRSVLSSALSLWRGTSLSRSALRSPLQPEQTLILYDMENCPFCRLVREALTAFDFDVEIRPCPKGGERFRPEVQTRGGKQQFPFLVDNNSGASMYESWDIVEYLVQSYGGGRRGAARRRTQARVPTAALSSVANGLRGFRVRASVAPKARLELYSFESSPYSRLVRELLCELELPYLLRNMGKATWKEFGPPAVRDLLWKADRGSSRNRKRLQEQTGRVQVPYLVDPNTGRALFESDAINAYLLETYAR